MSKLVAVITSSIGISLFIPLSIIVIYLLIFKLVPVITSSIKTTFVACAVFAIFVVFISSAMTIIK